jgi:Na+-driven multidrug efflux pump
VLAQGLALAGVIMFRHFGRTDLRVSEIAQGMSFSSMKEMITLGLPQSLGFIGILLVSMTIITALQLVTVQSYEVAMSAYGIVTRIVTCAFLPLLGISQAMQAIVGNNVGAGLSQRANSGFRIGLVASGLYCLTIESLLIGFTKPIGAAFTNDPAVTESFARIVPVMLSTYVISGPLMMGASYFQAIGDAKRAAVLGIAKPYLLTIPLIIMLASLVGERGIWFAMPVAEFLLLLIALFVMISRKKTAAMPSSSFDLPVGGRS